MTLSGLAAQKLALKKRNAQLASAFPNGIRCQKCLEYGHWSYTCKNKRKFVHRTSRTKRLNKNISDKLQKPIKNEPKIKRQKLNKIKNKKKLKDNNNTDTDGSTDTETDNNNTSSESSDDDSDSSTSSTGSSSSPFTSSSSSSSSSDTDTSTSSSSSSSSSSELSESDVDSNEENEEINISITNKSNNYDNIKIIY